MKALEVFQNFKNVYSFLSDTTRFFRIADRTGKYIQANPLSKITRMSTNKKAFGNWNAGDKNEGKIPIKAATTPIPIPVRRINRFSANRSLWIKMGLNPMAW